MDYFSLLPSPVTPLVVTIILLVTTFVYKKKSVARKIPEPGFAWPVIGHFRHLTATSRYPAHKVLGDLADKYGPIFRMRLGACNFLVVSDSRIAKECLATNDKAFAGRPRYTASEVTGYNYASFGFADAGPYWRDVRKTVVQELLSSRRLELLRRVQEFESRTFSKNIYEAWSKRDTNVEHDNYVLLDMKEWFAKFVIGVMLHILFGHRYKDVGVSLAATFRRNFELQGVLNVAGDYFRWLRWLDIGGYERAMRESAEEMDNIVDGWLQEHKKKRNNNMKPKEDQQEEEDDDFMDALLSHFSQHENDDVLNGFGVDIVVKATCSIVLAAATDTTVITLVWALTLIMNNYTVLDKIRAELDKHVGRERHVVDSDLNNLTYLHAVVKETLRLHPPGALLPPHVSMEDCMVNGYHISKGTRLLINVSKIHRDPNVWSNPNAFKPERFLTDNAEIDMKGNHIELIPFGSGRRMCPGMALGLQSVMLDLATVLHGFDVKRVSDKPIDTTEAVGLAVTKATPLPVLLKPRLSAHLYL